MAELEHWLQQLWFPLLDIHISRNNALRLKEKKYEHEDWVKNNGFFNHYFNQMKFLMAIQISKLLSDSPNQKFSFPKFLNQLENRHYSAELLQHMSCQDISFSKPFKCKEDVLLEVGRIREKLLENKDLIVKLNIARNKYYAHSDGKDDIKLPISEEYSILADLCADIYNSLKGGFFDTHTMFNHTTDWSIDWLIRSAAELKCKWLKEIEIKKKE